MSGLRKELRGHCPCGFSFAIYGEEEDAISLVQSHFDLYHKDFLPFGATAADAFALLEKTVGRKKNEIVKSFGSFKRKKTGSMSKKVCSRVRGSKRALVQPDNRNS